MVIKEIKVSARESVYLCQSIVPLLCIERLAFTVEGILIAEIAMVWTAS